MVFTNGPYDNAITVHSLSFLNVNFNDIIVLMLGRIWNYLQHNGLFGVNCCEWSRGVASEDP